MNIQHNENLREKLAAEYVLGTLKGGARRRLESWFGNDAALRRAIAEWQDRLCPLAELMPAVQPSKQVWRGIISRIEDASLRASVKQGWRDSVQFWRGLGMVSTLVAALLVAVMLLRQPTVEVAPSTYVAMLTNEQAQAAMVIVGDPKTRQLTVKVVMPQNIASDRSLELWSLPKDGLPRSLGLVATNGEVTLTLPDNISPENVGTLAISLEPKGGSGNPNAASGPILYKGDWIQI
tara:strand:+ start:67274 stop:67981 length:708 start_codon:yes stop_codon:yes gene_type:complete